MILDVHAHVGRPIYAYRSEDFTNTDLAARMSESGVAKCCVFSFYDIFGSDAPWGNFDVEILKIKKAARKDRDLELVLGGNLARLLGLPS